MTEQKFDPHVDEELDEGLDESFPASDPPSVTEPGHESHPEDEAGYKKPKSD